MSTVEATERVSEGIPPQWVYADFEEIFENVSLTGLKIPQKRYLSVGAFPVVDQGTGLIGGYTDDADKVIDRERSLIVFGDHTKCFKHVPFPFAPGADGIKVLEPRRPCDERFAYYGCMALQLPDRGYSRHYSFLKKCRLPIAPLGEQRRIVAKIEELFSELDNGVENLQRARAQIEVYRQALLKHTFEGKLTSGWRKENRASIEAAEDLLHRIAEERETRYQHQVAEWQTQVVTWTNGGKSGKKPRKPRRKRETGPLTPEELVDFAELPAGWKWVKLGELVWSVKDGPHYSPEYADSGVPFITGGNVRPNGVDFSTAKFISPELHRELSARCKPEKGDLLYTKGGTTGIARVNTYDIEFNVWVHVAVLKITESLRPFYLQHALNSPKCYQQAQKYTVLSGFLNGSETG